MCSESARLVMMKLESLEAFKGGRHVIVGAVCEAPLLCNKNLTMTSMRTKLSGLCCDECRSTSQGMVSSVQQPLRQDVFVLLVVRQDAVHGTRVIKLR